jgi:hypothetical protein
MIDKKIQLVTIVSGIVFLGGVLRLFIFYKLFDVNILPFLEAGEILVLTFDSIFYFLIVLTALFLVLFLFYQELLLNDKVSSEPHSYKLLSTRKIAVLVISMAGLAFFNFWLRSNSNTLDFIFWCFLLLIIFYVVPICFFKVGLYLSKRGINTSNFSLLTIFSSLILLCGSFLLPINEAHKVKRGFYVDSIIVLTTNEVIKSTSDFTFVGMTKNYLFFFDTTNGKTEIRKNELSKFQTRGISIKPGKQ